MHATDPEKAIILLIESDPKVSKQVQKSLTGSKKFNFDVKVLSSLSEALKKIKKKQVDLALVSPWLSDEQGVTVLAKIRKKDAFLPLIVLTQKEKPEIEIKAAAFNIKGFFYTDKLDKDSFCASIRAAVNYSHWEKENRFEQSKYKNIIDNLEDAYYENDLSGRYIYVNKASCRHFGRPLSELIGTSYKETAPENLQKKLQKEFNKIYKTGKSGKIIDNEIIRPDGTTFFTELSVSIIRDEDGKPVAFSGISRDVTEKKKALMALEASEERYRNILASIDDGYFEVDLKGCLTFFNDAMARILGYKRDDLMNRSHRDYTDLVTAERLFTEYNRIYKTGNSPVSLEYEVICPDQSKIFIETSVSLIRNFSDDIIGFRGIARDITDRKQFVLELEEAKKGAEQASLAKSEFLANMSHEIRTPMNGIIGMYNLLLGTELSDEQSDYVTTGKRSADALLSIINDILDFSKIEAGKMDIENIDFDLRKSVEEIVALPAVQAHTKGLEFAYQIDNEVPTLLKGDPGRLRQIIMNLCTNAIKFTEEGEVVFRVGLDTEADKSATLHFSLQDTGIGISKKDQDRLFTSFQQVDASTTRKYGGTGLGLAISKRLAELMGGTISVESEPGRGATFWFSCVFEKQDAIQEVAYENVESIQGKRIIIVDDNQTNLDILCGYLDHWGCSCDQATSGEMALTLMRAVAKAGAPYDLVISDMLMPKMDGAELGRLIKADPQLKNCQMIMLTSQGLRGDAAQMKEIGFNAYLNKPVRRSLLYDCMISVVNDPKGSPKKPKKRNLVTAHSISEAKRHNLKILLVEDNPVNRKVATHLLHNFGFKVDTANNGKEAIQVLEKNSYDVVFMDVQMPEMDGIEATGIIRDTGSAVLNHDVVIIAMTAHAMKGDREMCIKAGMNDYVSKPVKPNALLSVIEKNARDLLQ